jgi:hypothetical protein
MDANGVQHRHVASAKIECVQAGVQTTGCEKQFLEETSEIDFESKFYKRWQNFSLNLKF